MNIYWLKWIIVSCVKRGFFIVSIYWCGGKFGGLIDGFR